MEDELYPTTSPMHGTAPHLQMCHLLTGTKTIPQVSLPGLFGYQRKGTEKQAIDLHQGWEQGCRACRSTGTHLPSHALPQWGGSTGQVLLGALGLPPCGSGGKSCMGQDMPIGWGTADP